jgi:hypothetical protein
MSGQTVLGFSRNRRKGGAVENLPVELQTDVVAYKLSIGREAKMGIPVTCMRQVQ